MPSSKPRRKYPAKDVLDIGEKFFQYLGSRGHQGVTEKEALRDLYYDEFKPSLQGQGVKVCGFSTLINFLKRNKRIRVKDGHVVSQRAYDSVTIDQYTTIRKSEEVLNEEGSPASGVGDGGRRSGQRKRYPCLCEVCGVKVNSEVSYRDHIRGNRHRVNMLKKDLNSKRGGLIETKNGVSLETDYDDDNGNVTTQMQRGTTKEVCFIIKSVGDREIALISIALLRPRKEFSVKDEHKVFDGVNILRMPKGCEYTVQLLCCNADNLGRLASPIVFAFRLEDTREIFQVLRFVSVTVVSDVIDDLPPSKPYTNPPKFTAREKRGEIVEGIQLSFSSNNPLKGIPLGFFDVPRELQNTVNNRRNLPQLRDRLKQPLTVDNHREKFHELLYVEELQMQVDIRRYDRMNQTLDKDKQPNMLRLHVPGLAENRPSVLRGDHLFARFSDKSDKKSYKGYVHRVEQENLVLGFHADFRNKYIQGMKVDIEFTFSRFPIRNQHQAVESATVEGRLSDALFPGTGSKVGTKGQFSKIPELQAFKRTLFDQKLSKNMEQVQAVHQIVTGTARPAPYLVFGPPGTGKTVTIVEAAKQVYHLLPESRILVSAPSNSAADLVAVRLLNKGTPIAKTHLMRLYAPSRPLISIDPVLKEKKCCNLGAYDLYVPTKDEIMTKRIVVTTLVTAGRIALAQFPDNFFTHVFIDEAGHATEPEALIALAGVMNLDNPKGGQVILAGDPRQLGPVLRSPLAIENGLALSYLERLMTQCPAYSRKDDAGATNTHYDQRILTKLLQNYRSHPDILKLPNEMFYDKELKVFADELVRESFCRWDELPKQGFPIIFHGVEGQDEREEQSPSFFNKSEVEIVVDYVKKVMEKRGGQKIKQEDIGVISPYRKQVEKLRQVLKKRRFDDIKVGSVEEFQGQERMVIIISTVRSTKAEYIEMDIDFKLGFLKNPKRFNVAVTRAKALLVIVGNPFMLSKDEHWNQMLKFCIENGGYRGCTYNAEENDVDTIIELLKKVHLGSVPTVEEVEEELGFSHVAQQNDPEWRGED
ncbi:putative helicase MOV-10 [Lytechinus variegatus]|uniref:putative helicase MOV-10 n=1 Tax=Lytechinus variegatus TaxID=7654 RepID=UPI001BB2477E|nr:putative helicase MOV-10 [Lytechinus variegatus]XP_041457696.1 putative helicase MOV-10 [Lytechinus variegatus]XP_041457697.1 putative helicase MOV-10 [Lytechinus variegatus]XP_041457698.1 putative helicase MOV-10 [Lytechinus variegatus]XP_041457699.1 putative helicase MOV-10 [Lytechinus variegatus]XP_041457700.1 putative helicase MOV-10 [Lytechinus variegatus]XP_041457701.1 putative helicase MOV-10 [Lytechinus variegatus]XP_041457702.1 putative helicase MOV-10 [Lytechinus variegatus]